MRTRVIVLSAALSTCASPATAQTVPTTSGAGQTAGDTATATPWSADERAIRRLPEAWKKHYNAGEAEQVANLYAPDAYYLSAHVLAHGREAIQAYWERGIAAGGHIDTIEPLAVYHDGALGYFVGRYQATNAGVTVDGRILIVVKRVQGAWLMAAHETVVRDQP